ncbi:MAG TPA: substrate-binding domain-containing protein [Oleiagrimonas sp.]|nr:substrate-binding domain-containing protein [Oleiagrimonas sp.]
MLAVAMVFGVGTASAADPETAHYTIAMVTHAQPGDSFWDQARKGGAAAAGAHHVDFIYLHGKTPRKQAAALRNVITQHVDGIALTLAFPNALRPLIEKARAAGIPVVAFNSGFHVWKSMGIPMYVGQDERLAGNQVGERLNRAGIKKQLCVNQQQGAVQLAARCEGIAETFKGTAETLYLKRYDMSVARTRIVAKLIQDPDIGAVVTLGSPFAPVAVRAVRMANSDAKVVTFDLGSMRIAKLIKAGKIAWAVDQQPYLQGYEAVDLLWLNITNGNVLGGGKPVLTGPTFVTGADIDQIIPFIKRGTR